MNDERSLGRLVAWLTLVGSLTALAYVGRATDGEPEDDVLYQYDTAVAGAILYGLVLALVLLICHRGSLRELLALRRPASWGGAAAVSGGIFVAMLVLGAALDPFLDAGEEQGLTPDEWQPERAGAFAANAVVVVGAAPLVEELTYRGLGFSVLSRFGDKAAIVLVGIAFGVAHGLLIALPILIAFGVGLGYLRARTGSVYPPILLHALFNSFSLALAVTV